MGKYSNFSKGVNLKLILYAAIVVGVVIALKQVKGFINLFTGGNDGGEVEENTQKLSKPAGVQPTINTGEAKALALRLYSAMDGAGTDEEEIISIFNAANTADVAMIYNEFKVRDGEDLVSWLRGDLSDDEFNYLAPKLIGAGLKV
jgi:hypothetical protein